ncbi:unnamed protein product [Trichobilharzia regenti]|nr:unnamed protein product [Trichobilharzia regenti]
MTTGEVICGGISAALRNRRFSAQLTATATNKPIPTFSKTENLLPCNENHSSEIKANEANESFPTKANNISTNVECDDILNEESSLRQECDLVLKELAAWRKMYSHENMVNCEDKRTRHSDVKSKNNLQSTNCRRKDKLNKKSMNLTENKAKCDSQKNNNTQCKMNSSTDESHIKTNYSSYSVDDRSINHQSNSTKLNSSLSSFLPILQTNGKSIKVDSPVSSSSSSCSPRKQAPEQSTSGVESSFDEQMVVNNDNSIQDLQVTKSSVKNDPSSPSSPPEPPLHQLKQKQSEFSKMKTSKSPVVYANHRINKTESGNKLAMRMSRTSSTTIQALPSKPLVKREKIE